jgi:NAD(P)H-hydrate epimerase
MYIGSQSLMKEYDSLLLQSGYTIEELVDKASDCLLKHFINSDHICLLCGIGNNGADGYSLAEKLFDLNKDVYVIVVGDINKFSQAATYYYQKCIQKGILIDHIDSHNFDDVIHKIKHYHIIVDAMFGFGLHSSPRGIYSSVIEEVNHLYDKEIISVDIPTGLDCNSGEPYQSVICATKTITLTALKNGFLNPDSAAFTGEIIVEMLNVKDISQQVGLYKLIERKDVHSLLKERIFDGHKGTYGRILSITGCSNYKGAALMNVKASVYSGSGVVTLMSDQDVNNALAIFCPEATSLIRKDILDEDDFKKYDSILIGSGLGLNNYSQLYLKDILIKSSNPLVIDGDGLTILSQNIDLLKNQNRPIILTPHFGEMQRLMPISKDDDVLAKVTEFAKENHVILVLKGPYTMISDGIHSYRIDSGNKAMSVGGMGDCLAGMINSFVGQGYEPIDACVLAVYIHGYCGDMLEKDHYTVIPSKLIELIPKAMKDLLIK